MTILANAREILIRIPLQKPGEVALPDLKAIPIGPKEAAALLELNVGNRPFRKKVAESYAKDMKEGRWYPGKQPGLTFDEEGLLVEGQHRLHAVILANVTIPFYIQRGVPREAVTQSELKRTFKDHQAICGRPADEFMIAIQTILQADGHRSRPVSYAEKAELLKPFEEAAAWAMKLFPQKVRGVVIAGTVAAVASTYHTVLEHPSKMRRIKDFASKLVSMTCRSEFEDQDSALKPLLSWLERTKIADEEGRILCYLYTQGVIECYLRNKPRKKLFLPEPGSIF